MILIANVPGKGRVTCSKPLGPGPTGPNLDAWCTRSAHCGATFGLFTAVDNLLIIVVGQRVGLRMDDQRDGRRRSVGLNYAYNKSQLEARESRARDHLVSCRWCHIPCVGLAEMECWVCDVRRSGPHPSSPGLRGAGQ